MPWHYLKIGYLGVLLLLFWSCGRQSQSPKYLVGFSQCTAGDSWRRAMQQEMDRELAFHPELELITRDAQNNSQLQVQQIKELLKMGIDLLIVSPNEATPITPIIDSIFHEGLPVVIIDRRTTSNLYTAYVGADNYGIGKTAGQYIAGLLKEKGKILEVWGLPGSSPAKDRHNGFLEGIKAFPQIQVVDQVYGDWELDTARHRVQQWNTHKEPVDLIFAHNDVMALGAYEVFKDQEPPLPKFVGVDGLAGPTGGIQFVEDEVLTATLLYPTGGEEAITIAANILNNSPIEKENILQTTVIDAANVRVMKMQADKILSQQRDITRQQDRIDGQIEIYQTQQILVYFLVGSLVLAILLGGAVLYNLRAKQEINKALKAKNSEILAQRNKIMEIAEEARIATQAKIKFFTNISHEFRTPLTLILGPVDELLQKDSTVISPPVKKDLGLIQKNAFRLLRLVNQLMDFRKIENNKMAIRVKEGDLIAFIQDIIMTYERMAKNRAIDFSLQTDLLTFPLYFDHQILDKVLFNLLSNAFKFTENGGRITIGVSKKSHSGQVVISVQDNGRGMSEEHVAHVFERFYQGETYKTEGTGLGLSFSKELIKLHKGDISVASQKGNGTRFEISLPLEAAIYSQKERESATEEPFTIGFHPHLTIENEAAEIAQDSLPELGDLSAKRSMLIVEDEIELREFLAEKFSKEYVIFEAGSSQAGQELAFDHLPDLIICDVMLPGESGLMLTKTLKNDLRTSHIPIIMLTAKHSVEEQIKGAQAGADVYLTKPFNLRHVKEVINNLISNREILKDRYLSELAIDNPQESSSKLDKKFINHFITIVENQLSNPNLEIQDICQEMGLSRVQLYRKLKALLGYSAADYIKNVRLKKAQHLLQEGELSIGEVAYAVGFSSPAYFSTAFKAKYGISPNAYRNK